MAVETALEGLSRPLERQDALDDRSNHARSTMNEMPRTR